jgi:phosphate transport system permease protein
MEEMPVNQYDAIVKSTVTIDCHHGGFPSSRRTGMSNARTLVAGAVTLGFVMLPQILIGTHEALKAVDPVLRETAHALGVSHSYLFFRVIWPVAWPAILTSVVLSAIHALGAAAPLLFTAATVFTKETVALSKPVMALPTHLYFVTAEIGAVPYAFGTALVLAGLVLSVSVIALIFKRRHVH